MNPLRVAILGAGFMGQVHFQAWSALAERGVEVVAVAKSDGKAREWLSRVPSVRVVTDFRKVAEMAGVDVVDICLPTLLHRPAIEMAAAAGRAVLCEKPLALTSADAEAAVETVRRHGVPFMVAHVVRFFPEYRMAREIALRGDIGAPRSARCFRGGALPAWNTWMRDEGQSGGVILDLMIHDIDYLRWLFGPVARVTAVASPVGSRGEQHAALLMRFENDAIALVEGAWSYPTGSPFETEAEIAGTSGLIQWSSRTAQSFRVFSKQWPEVAGRFAASPVEPDPYRVEIEHFLDHVLQGTPPKISPEDAVAAVRVAEGAIRSAKEGRPMEVHA